MLCLGESKRAKEEKVDYAPRTIALLEFEALCDFEEKSYLSRHMWKERKAYRERNAQKLARYRETNKHITLNRI